MPVVFGPLYRFFYPALRMRKKPDRVQQVLDKADRATEPLFEAINFRQIDSLKEEGAYWQLLPTHSEHPKDGKDTDGDRLERRPTNEKHGWERLPVGALPCTAQVDVYDGPRGKGYTITLHAKIGPETWRRVHNHGPETERELEWTLV